MTRRCSGIWASLALLLAAGSGSAALAQDQPAGGQPPATGQPMQPAQPAQPPAAPAPPGATERDVPGPPFIRPGIQQSVLVFDFENASMNALLGPDVTHYVQDQVKAGLIASGAYYLVTFNPRLALVRKAIQDEILRQDDLTVTAPDTGALAVPRALRLAYRLRIQSILTGALEAVELNRMSHTATVTLTVTMINSRTGETMHTASVSGSAVGTAETPELELLRAAADDAAAKAMAEFGVVSDQQGPAGGDEGEGGGGGGKGGLMSLFSIRKLPPALGLVATVWVLTATIGHSR